MFLSRVRLNPTRITTRRLLGSPQITHALVMGSIPGVGGAMGDGRVLWRLDRAGADLTLYVASPQRPDFTGTVEQAGWPTSPTWDSADYGPFLGRLEAGQLWRFRLAANPTASVPTQTGRGRLRPLRTVGQQREWLLARADRVGAHFPRDEAGEAMVQVSQRHTHSFIKGLDEERRRVDLTVAVYDGLLEVADAAVLRRTLTDGLGRAKGYGCGLLTLAPPP